MIVEVLTHETDSSNAAFATLNAGLLAVSMSSSILSSFRRLFELLLAMIMKTCNAIVPVIVYGERENDTTVVYFTDSLSRSSSSRILLKGETADSSSMESSGVTRSHLESLGVLEAAVSPLILLPY